MYNKTIELEKISDEKIGEIEKNRIGNEKLKLSLKNYKFIPSDRKVLASVALDHQKHKHVPSLLRFFGPCVSSIFENSLIENKESRV